jgi:hypothetical protein
MCPTELVFDFPAAAAAKEQVLWLLLRGDCNLVDVVSVYVAVYARTERESEMCCCLCKVATKCQKLISLIRKSISREKDSCLSHSVDRQSTSLLGNHFWGSDRDKCLLCPVFVAIPVVKLGQMKLPLVGNPFIDLSYSVHTAKDREVNK